MFCIMHMIKMTNDILIYTLYNVYYLSIYRYLYVMYIIDGYKRLHNDYLRIYIYTDTYHTST